MLSFVSTLFKNLFVVSSVPSVPENCNKLSNQINYIAMWKEQAKQPIHIYTGYGHRFKII
jgi:hypothetical protein